MGKTETSSQSGKIKGLLFARIIWIAGALIFGVYAVTVFLSIGSEGQDTADCVKSGIGLLIYFLAYGFGVFYLFSRKRQKTVLICTGLYAAAYLFSLVILLTGGSRVSADNLVTKILNLAGYLLFAAFTGILVTGKPEKALPFCRKFWFLPTLLLVAVGIIGSLWTEIVRPDGFLLDGFALDLLTAIIMAVPVFLMSRVVKERSVQKHEVKGSEK